MDWFHHRCATAVDAFTARRVLVFGTIVAGGALAVRIALHFAGGDPMLLGAPEWTWWVMGAAAFTLFFLFEYTHRLRMAVVSNISLSFNPDCIVQTPTKIRQAVQGTLVETDSNAVYVCLKIESLSKLAIKDCAALITSIEKRDKKSGSFIPIRLADAVPVRVPFTIYHGVPNYVGFLEVHESNNVLQIPGQYPLILLDAFRDHTVYRVTISVIADGVTSRRQVDVTWAGVWNGITAVSVDPS